jgi:L-ascorbate metabolism protein UlaG (beta-lactamase superfamily)
LTFVGTATTVIELGSFTLLTDPNFLHRGQHAYLGKGLFTRRLTDPALTVTELPPLDVVVLSHLHGDHFDRVARRRLTRHAPVVTTPHAARRLDRWGFTAKGLRTWEDIELTRGDELLRITSVPGIHARGVLAHVLPPVMGTVVEHRVGDERGHLLYISGDTLTGDHLDRVRERFPDIDTAVVHLGGTRVLLHTVTMDAQQGVDFLERIRPRIAVPVHHSDYPVFRSSLTDFVLAASRADLSGIRRVRPGERLDLARATEGAERAASAIWSGEVRRASAGPAEPPIDPTVPTNPA